ncbi:Uncharacterized membrane protein YsdA, DUF1294 family [Geosporobacter subterraneus DSM 17957]|uniref:Uncharacterized membrane protein YsdA, DUF1294 family n=1 Tax=Geosporobacter subterraneus DSM 17957 TaxID=1121919 RepID=A0A1M6PUA9_9FIRM|nr:DUF1294 domain-containing protein [Geosporobacter subterraneus]SHK11574.1 Uncharacterized membrane protein YsdA, DUF1294 family [Geosporobacter subterraneus DSM 17957]
MPVYEWLNARAGCISVYILVINTVGYIMTALDKHYAKTHRWRIAEKIFFIVSLIGGAGGVLFGMKTFRHKTLHKSFSVGVPLLLIMNMACLFLLIYVFYLK